MRGLVTISAWNDLAHTGASVNTVDDPICSGGFLRGLAYLVADAAEHKSPELSPLYNRFQGLPPMLLMAGEQEALRDDTVRAASKARGRGRGNIETGARRPAYLAVVRAGRPGNRRYLS